MQNSSLDDFIVRALQEDIGEGDHTSLACIPSKAMGKAHLLVKDKGILAGIDIAAQVLRKIEPDIRFDKLIPDGSTIFPGDIAFLTEGHISTLLMAERLVLNIMQRMSGIATTTNRYVQRLEGLKTKILDTRKTTPGMRMLEKMAVKIGGGVNHRFGLFDMILIKDNHIDFAGGISDAIDRTKKYLHDSKKELAVEIEARNLDDVALILKTGGINRILLDNFNIDDTRKAVLMIGKKYETESSGGITYENLRDYAECGVDFISVGALTHHIQSLDLSMKAV
jgi:nicotinate-nucleotide pyrophosphorylase (carboxylating)